MIVTFFADRPNLNAANTTVYLTVAC